MAMHVPAPWRVLDYASEKKGFIAIVAGEKEHICDVFPFGARDGGIKREIEQHQANARLIAAAPALEEALSVVVAMVEDYLTDTTQDRDHLLTALDGARAALAKASAG